MLSPFLIVGVGGSGGKTLRALRAHLQDRLKEAGWDRDLPAAWQFIHVDSPTQQDGKEFPFDYLPTEDYVGLVAPGIAYRQQYAAALGGVPNGSREIIQNALPSDAEVRVPINLGAGMYRAIGRTLILAKMQDVQRAVKDALQRINGPDAASELRSLSELLGNKSSGDVPKVTAVLVSSIAGGSGAGQFLDVAEAIKSAAFAEPWIHDMFSVLYAPDVFRNITGSKAIAPNALFAMAESMSGMWTKRIPDATIDLFQAKGVNVAENGSAVTHIGPRYNYMVGIQNESVNFGSQTAVYKAVAAGLSTWVTSELVQSKIGAYTVANFVASTGAMNMDDNSHLRSMTTDSPPFSALGFGRVGLGREIFGKYASERLTQGALDTLMDAVIKEDPNLTLKTREEYVEISANQVFEDFIKDMNLREDGQTVSDVLPQIRPDADRATIQSQLRSKIQLGSQQGLNKQNTQTVEAWINKIAYFYNQDIAVNVEADAQARKKLLIDWVANQQKRAIEVVGRYAAQRSIQVASALVAKLSDAVNKSASDLASLASRYQGWGSDCQTLVAQTFTSGIQEKLPPQHPMVQQALDRAVQCFGFRVEGDLLETASKLLRDFADNFLGELRGALDNSYSALAVTLRDGDSGVSENNFSSWPLFSSTQIPAKFYPAKNEFLLLDTDQYPAEFDTVLNSSIGDSQGRNARQVVLTQILVGSADPVVAAQIDEKDKWSLVQINTRWVPQRSDCRREGEAASRAKFEIAIDPSIYLERTNRWLNREGTAFNSYLNESLSNYLDDTQADQSLLLSRLSKFREQFASAVKASKPLIKLNAAMMQAVHGGIAQSDITLSQIPFGPGSRAYDICREVLIDAGEWDDQKSEDWFDSSVNVRRIDIFSLQNPYQPIVMDSILEPIGRTWLENRNDANGREDFLRWRKARPLNEAIAASSSVWKAMLKGWYVAKLLGQLDLSQDQNLGPKLEVWSGKQGYGNRKDNYEFPHPLLHVSNPSSADYPGLVLYSLSIALVMSNLENNLNALQAYGRLRELGEALLPLKEWILNGIGPDANHPINPQRAGTSADPWDARKAKVLAHLEKERTEFMGVYNQEVRPGVQPPIITWEIREEILAALTEIVAFVESLSPDESGI